MQQLLQHHLARNIVILKYCNKRNTDLRWSKRDSPLGLFVVHIKKNEVKRASIFEADLVKSKPEAPVGRSGRKSVHLEARILLFMVISRNLSKFS